VDHRDGRHGTLRSDQDAHQAERRHRWRIFLLDRRPFTAAEIGDLVGRLRAFVPATIMCGSWIATKGHEFDRIVVQRYEP